MSSITVLFRFQSNPGEDAAVEAKLRGLASAARSAAGNQRSDLFQSPDGWAFYLIQRFADEYALQSYRNGENYLSALRDLEPRLAAAPEIRRLNAIDVAGD